MHHFRNENSRANSVSAFMRANHTGCEQEILRLLRAHRDGLNVDGLVALGRFDPCLNGIRPSVYKLQYKGLVAELRGPDGELVNGPTRSGGEGVLYVLAEDYPHLPTGPSKDLRINRKSVENLLELLSMDGLLSSACRQELHDAILVLIELELL